MYPTMYSTKNANTLMNTNKEIRRTDKNFEYLRPFSQINGTLRENE